MKRRSVIGTRQKMKGRVKIAENGEEKNCKEDQEENLVSCWS